MVVHSAPFSHIKMRCRQDELSKMLGMMDITDEHQEEKVEEG